MQRRATLLLLVTLTLLVACDDDPDPTPADSSHGDADSGDEADAPGGDDADSGGEEDSAVDTAPDVPPADPRATLRFDPGSADFFDLPMPSDARLDAEGRVTLREWSKAYNINLLKLWFDAGEELIQRWGLVSGVFAWFDAPLDPATLPASIEATTTTEGGAPPVALVDVDPGSPEQGRMFPLTCRYVEAEGTLHPAWQLGCHAPFGIVRRPNTRYAFVITKALKDTTGEPVETPPAMQQLLDGQTVQGRHGALDGARWQEAVAVLEGIGIPATEIAGLELFTTGDPAERLRRVAAWYDALPEPTLAAPLEVVQTFEDYIVLRGQYDVPVIQAGQRPFANPPDGKIQLGDDGRPVPLGSERLRFLLTIPRQPMPPGGWPVLHFMHGSGGRAEQLTDRGPEPNPPPGSGPARVVAEYGVAGFASDFPLHGERFSPPDTTGLMLYNLISNPRATIDNFIVAACEVTLHHRLLVGLVVDPALAPGVLDAGEAPDGMIRFNTDRLTSMGQSMGSTIGLPAVTVDRVVDSIILSGSGGSLVEIASTSMSPVNVAGLLKPILRYRADELLDQYDLALHTVQLVWDFVDTLVHARHVLLEPYADVPPKHVLQHSGLTDSYFSPASRAGLAAALGVDLVEPVHEDEALDIMRWSGHGAALATPVIGNASGGLTAVSAQYPPSVLDGHNVAYQRDDAKTQYACFARTFAFKPVEQASPEACLEAP